MVKLLAGLLVCFTLTVPASAIPTLVGEPYGLAFHAETCSRVLAAADSP